MKFTKLLKAPIEDRKAAYVAAREQYYSAGNSSLTDAEYDSLEDSIKAEDPKWKYLRSTGTKAKIGKKEEVKLTVPCPSLDKLVVDKPEAIAKWVARSSSQYGELFFISEKLDGSSVEATYEKGQLKQLATRGDGTTGKSIKFLAPHLNLPLHLKSAPDRLVIRFEAVMKSKVYADNWCGLYDSARALSSAVLNRQDASSVLKDLDFVALRLLHPGLSLSKGLALLKKFGFLTVQGKVFDLSVFPLGDIPRLLEYVRSVSKYECDGIVACSDRSNLETTADRPDYARAIKMNDEVNAQVTTIKSIVWRVSAFGVIVPKAVIEPVMFGGVTVKHAALHNAAWAIERGVGVGAKVKVLRSGDIIPKIVAVVKPKPFELPSKSQFGSYAWDKTKTALVLETTDSSPAVSVEKISRMFSKLGLDQLSSGLAEKLVKHGCTTTAAVANLSEADFASLPGVKSTAKVFATQMRRIQNGEFDLPTLMVASGCFSKGLGETRLRALEAYEPRALQRENSQDKFLQRIVADGPGCGPAFAQIFCDGIKSFWEWMDETNAKFSRPQKLKVVNGPLTGKFFSWTGYRSKEEEDHIASLGGKVVSFGSKTSVLFHRQGGKASSKLEKAASKGVEISTYAAYLKKAVT